MDPFRTATTDQESPFRSEYGRGFDGALTSGQLPESESPFRAGPGGGNASLVFGLGPTEWDFEIYTTGAADPEFAEMLDELAMEARSLYVKDSGAADLAEALEQPDTETRFERFFSDRYEPLAQQVEMNLDRFANYLQENLREDMDLPRAEGIIDRFEPAATEQFFGRVKKWVKKAGQGLKTLAQKGLKAVGKIIPLSIILRKLKPVIRPLLKRVLKAGLRFVPPKYRESARRALEALGGRAAKLGGAGTSASPGPSADTGDSVVAELLPDVDTEVGVDSEIEQELAEGFDPGLPETEAADFERDLDAEIYRLGQEQLGETPMLSSLVAGEGGDLGPQETVSLERARRNYINAITGEAPDIERLTEGFLPAVLTAVRFGIKLIGRERVVNFLAKAVARLIGPVVGPDLSGPLSRIVVDAGLKLIGAETGEKVDPRELVGQMVANTVTEAAARVASLPESILDGEDEVVEAYTSRAVQDSIANNFPSAALSAPALATRNIPRDADWVPVDKGRYKVLSRRYSVTLDPDDAATVRTLYAGETLDDMLAEHQAWDLEKPEEFEVRLFEALPQTLLSSISERYVGGTGPEHVAQIVPLTRRAAEVVLSDPALHSPAGAGPKRFMMLRRRGAAEGPRRPGVPRRRFSMRVRDGTIVFAMYIGERTAQKLKRILRSPLTTLLLRRLQRHLVAAGTEEVRTFLVSLRVPPSIARPIAASIVRWAARDLLKLAAEVRRKFSAAADAPARGVTVRLALKLHFDLKDLLKITPINLPQILAGSPSATVDVVPGYRL